MPNRELVDSSILRVPEEASRKGKASPSARISKRAAAESERQDEYSNRAATRNRNLWMVVMGVVAAMLIVAALGLGLFTGSRQGRSRQKRETPVAAPVDTTPAASYAAEALRCQDRGDYSSAWEAWRKAAEQAEAAGNSSVAQDYMHRANSIYRSQAVDVKKR
jgi:hypothetical protein